MFENYIKLYEIFHPEIFLKNYVFGTSMNNIYVFSKTDETITDEENNTYLPYYHASVLKFEFLFNKFDPSLKKTIYPAYKNKYITIENGKTYVSGSYATYFKDLEQAFYFDIMNSNPNYTGMVKIWNRGKKQLQKVLIFENGKPIKVISGEEYGSTENKNLILYL